MKHFSGAIHTLNSLKSSLSIPNKFMSKNEKFLLKVDYIVIEI